MQIEQAFMTLGVPQTANIDVVKRSYRKLVSKWHPDRNPHPDAQQKTQGFNVAWEVLHKHLNAGSSSKPKAGSTGFSTKAHARGHQAKPKPTQKHAHKASNKEASKHANERRKRPRGATFRRVAFITKEQARNGMLYEITGIVGIACTTCNSGAHANFHRTCRHCDGAGKLFSKTSLNKGTPSSHACMNCQSTGRVEQTCPDCHGYKRCFKQFKFKFQIKPGAQTGDKYFLWGDKAGTPLEKNDAVSVLISVKD